MAKRSGETAQFLCTLVYVDEPQVVLLKKGDDSRLIAVAVEKADHTYPFFAAEINLTQWQRYRRGFVDLRYLFTFPRWKRWYLFDLADMADGQVSLERADDSRSNESFLPQKGFFSREHTEPDLEEEIVKLETQNFAIDGSWDLPDFAQFYGKFTDLYYFFLGLRKYTSEFVKPEIKRQIRDAFAEHPLRGGSSYVNLYHDLFSAKEMNDALSVDKIRYASPGYVVVNGSADVFADIDSSLEKFASSYDEVKAQYLELHGYLRKMKLLSSSVERFDKDGAVAKYLVGECKRFAETMELSDFDLVYGLTGKNALGTAKILLSHFRRLERYYMFFAEGRVEEGPEVTPSPNRDS
ncbi:MAG: hypothetical protein GEU87_17280 [Alphaproteobacteria bacterium]|nr:hypothetical protein [Alphaproteobacteria bacterium]